MLTVLQTNGSNTSHQQKTGVNHSAVDLKCSCLCHSSLMFCSLASLSFEEAVYMQSCISYCCAEVFFEEEKMTQTFFSADALAHVFTVTFK